MSVIPVAEARRAAGVDAADASQDAVLQRMLDAAEDIVAAQIGPLAPVQVTEAVVPRFGVAVLQRRPIQALTSVTVGGVALTTVQANLPAGLLYIRDAATVVYNAGFGSLPPLVREVILDLVRARYESRPGALPPGVEVAEEALAEPFPTNDAAILARLTPHRHAMSVG